MNERRFRAALDEIQKTIYSYGEEEILAALGVIAERFGYEFVKRDPGPCCCDYGDFYERQGIMAPIHDCPAPEPISEDDMDLFTRAFDLPRLVK